jgi:hypothetical protein
MMQRLAVSCLVVAVAGVAFAGPAVAQQEAAQPLAMISYFTTDIAHAEPFVEAMKGFYAGTLGPMMEDGSVLSWGIVEPVVHHDMAFTHAVFTTVADWATVDRILAADEAAMAAMGEEEVRKMMASFAEMVDLGAHRDEMVRHVVFEVPPPAEGQRPGRYVELSYHRVLPGQGEAAMGFYERVVQPIYAGLAAQGVVTAYGVYVPELHGPGDWTHVGWLVLPDLAALDAVDRAFAADQAGLGEEEAAARGAEMEKLFDDAGHRDELFKIVHFGGG